MSKKLLKGFDDFPSSAEFPALAAFEHAQKSVGGAFIFQMAITALHRNIESVEFLKLDNDEGVQAVYRTGEVEIGGGMTIPESWDRVIRQLKVMAKTVDHGPYKSDKAVLEIAINKKRTARFFIDSNPNPSTDTRVLMVNASYVKPTA